MKFPDKTLLITGPQRSGTTWLAAMLGLHPKISMLMEDKGWAVNNLMSCKYGANKLIAGRQVRYDERGAIWKNGLDRLNIFKRNRIFPMAKTCMKDYDKVITVFRYSDSQRRSVMTRTDFTYSEWESDLHKAITEVMKAENDEHLDTYTVSYELLKAHTRGTLIRICEFLEIDFQDVMLEGYKWTRIY